MAKLTETQVRAILLAPKSESAAKVGARFGVSKTTVSLIRNRRIWTHVVVETRRTDVRTGTSHALPTPTDDAPEIFPKSPIDYERDQPAEPGQPAEDEE